MYFMEEKKFHLCDLEEFSSFNFTIVTFEIIKETCILHLCFRWDLQSSLGRISLVIWGMVCIFLDLM